MEAQLLILRVQRDTEKGDDTMCFNLADAEKSLRGFEKFTAPAIKFAFGAKTIVPTERHETELEILLDRQGIDGLIVTVDGWTFSYASRVQFGKNYGAFTIRRSRPSGVATEYDKLKNPLQMKPTYHVQTFIDNDSAANSAATVAVVPTLELMKYVNEHQDQWRKTRDGETFYFVPFNDVAAKIYRIDSDGHVFEKK